MLSGHGNDKYCFEQEIVADFSSNVWFKPMPDDFYTQLANSLKNITDYPDPYCNTLRKPIAIENNLSPENVLVTNGSTEAIYLIAQAFAHKSSAIIYPCFSEYEDSCRLHRHFLTFISNNLDLKATGFAEDLVWIGNPNNPDGKKLPPRDIEKLLQKNPHTIFIIDEAYSELDYHFRSSAYLIHKYSNLVVLQSFTKAFAIAGIRLGYILASEVLIKKLLDYKIPWSVNSLAIEAGCTIMSRKNELLPSSSDLKAANLRFYEALSSITGIEVFPSDCNFFLIYMKNGSASELKKYLLEKFGLLIRDASNFRGLDDSFIRVSVQNDSQNDMLIDALKMYFNGIL